VTAPVAGRPRQIQLHVHPVDLLRDVDVVVSPTNTYLALPDAFKSSVAASLRRAGADRAPGGRLLADLVHDELRAWATEHGVPVLPGTVAPTGPGALAAQGIRRLYHAAVARPRPGTNDYDVLPSDITRSAVTVFRLMAAEDLQPRSVCFPLLGAGRGGLPAAVSAQALWAAVEAEFARGAEWEVHFVVRRVARAELLEQTLTSRPSAPGSRAR
jgi:O-acetyl-ADP-ribose deacetylase (regulator of RNase III)